MLYGKLFVSLQIKKNMEDTICFKIEEVYEWGYETLGYISFERGIDISVGKDYSCEEFNPYDDLTEKGWEKLKDSYGFDYDNLYYITMQYVDIMERDELIERYEKDLKNLKYNYV